MSKQSEKRLFFVSQALNRGLTDNVKLANEWYITNNAKNLATDEALRQFKEWLS